MTRQQAIANGQKFYEGKLCSKCGSTTRYTSIGFCVNCQILNMKKRHQDKKDLRRNQHKTWKQNHKGKNNAMGAKYRALKKSRVSEWTNHKLITYLYILCDLITTHLGPHHLDHITPISRGGVHCQSNLQIISAAMNLSKGSRVLTDQEHQSHQQYQVDVVFPFIEQHVDRDTLNRNFEKFCAC